MSATLEPMVQCASWGPNVFYRGEDGEYQGGFRVEVPGSKPGITYVVTHGYQDPPSRYMYGFHCTCPAFQFCKGEEKTCKHIEKVKKQCCLWHQQFDAEQYKHDGKCPRCGGPVQGIIVAV